jgi:anti-sigma B factor antagonist
MKTSTAKNNLTVNASEHPQHKDITLLSARGFIDTTTAPEFERTFQTVLGEKKFNIIIDLKDVSYISSAGWGIFVGEIKRIRNQKGNLFLVAMTPEVTDAYELLQFGTIIKSFPNLQEALHKGFGKPKVGKGATVKAAGKGPEPASVEKELGASPEAVATAASSPRPRKLPFLIRLFLPWKWF